MLRRGHNIKLFLNGTTSAPEDSRCCLMLLASPRTCGLLQWVRDCLPGQADTCRSSAAQGKLLWRPVAEHSTPTCTRHINSSNKTCAAAVGTMEVSSADIARSGLKGKGLKLLHHYPDLLWALGDKSTPDSSFTTGRIFSQQVWVCEFAAVAGDQAGWSAVNGPRQANHGALQQLSTPNIGRPRMPCWVQADAVQQDDGSTAASQKQAGATSAEQLGSLSLSAKDHEGANGHGEEAAEAAGGPQADAEAHEVGEMPQEAAGEAARSCCTEWASLAQPLGSAHLQGLPLGSAHLQGLRDAPELCIPLRGVWVGNAGQLPTPCRGAL